MIPTYSQRTTHWAIGIVLGVILGLAMLLAGGLQTGPAPACPHCAVLTHPWNGCDEAVSNGYLCP